MDRLYKDCYNQVKDSDIRRKLCDFANESFHTATTEPPYLRQKGYFFFQLLFKFQKWTFSGLAPWGNYERESVGLVGNLELKPEKRLHSA